MWEMWLGEEFVRQALIFVSLTLRSLGLALAIGLPIGIVLSRLPRVASPLVAGLALLQTVPSLALVGLMFPLLGLGDKAAITAAVAYSLFPIVLNTFVGITQVEPAIRDAARGMGMTGRQILLRVELPLAMPVILAGVRTGAVYTSGIITIAALVGAGGLGDYISTGLTRGDSRLIFVGVIPILFFTFLLFWGLGGLAWLSRRHGQLGLACGGSLILLLASYALAEPWLRPRRPDIVLGSKNFTEGQILTEILRLMLEKHTNLTIDVKTNLGSKLAYKALLNGDIDIYPEYTGNLLTGEDALAMTVPEDRNAITPLVREQMQRRFHVVLLETFGLDNTYVCCLPKKTARELGLKKISDLQRVPEFRVVVDLEFTKRPDGWHGLVRTYGLRFRQPPTQVGPDFLYRALETAEAELVVGFATDWQIDAMDLAVLEDDRGYFPSYHGAPLVRDAVLKRHPEIATVLNRLKGRIDDATMRRLNGQVAREQRTAAEVARTFLREQGLLD